MAHPTRFPFPMVKVIVKDGPQAGDIFELPVGTHCVGRASNNNIVLKEPSVSGKHLEIVVESTDEVHFRDLGSTNGTFSGEARVSDGEWFPGTSLRLGNVTLSFESSLEGSVGESHSRARQEVLDQPSSSPLFKIAGLFLVLGGGYFAYQEYVVGNQDNGEPLTRSNASPVSEGGVVEESFDLIDNLGEFRDVEAWQLDESLEIRGGVCSALQGGRARLNQSFSLNNSVLGIWGASDGTVRAEIQWGDENDIDRPVSTWVSAPIDEQGQELALPTRATWFKVILRFSENSSLQKLIIASPQEGVAKTKSGLVGSFKYEAFQGNLSFFEVGGEHLVSLNAHSGTWELGDQSFSWQPGDDRSFTVSVSDFYLSDVDVQAFVLASGGPVLPSTASSINNPAGFLCGTAVERFYFDFDGAVVLSGGLKEMSVEGGSRCEIFWDIRKPLTEASRLMQEIKSSLNQGDEKSLLSACSVLLRKYPLRVEDVEQALNLSRETLSRGKRELVDLQRRASSAMFVGASAVMIDLDELAQDLMSRYESTDIAVEAENLSLLMTEMSSQREKENMQRDNAYRLRVQNALKGSYGQLHLWLSAQEELKWD